jgi:hypothetical protein
MKFFTLLLTMFSIVQSLACKAGENRFLLGFDETDECYENAECFEAALGALDKVFRSDRRQLRGTEGSERALFSTACLNCINIMGHYSCALMQICPWKRALAQQDSTLALAPTGELTEDEAYSPCWVHSSELSHAAMVILSLVPFDTNGLEVVAQKCEPNHCL